MTRSFSRRSLLGAALAGATWRPARAAETSRLRVGYQKYGTLLVLKQRGTLERALAPQGVQVEWREFPAGPQLLEAMNVGAIDVGTAGETPPVFAQAASDRMLYVAHEPSAPRGEAILVPQESPVRSLADLKGRKVALNKGSNVHYLLLRALAAAKLGPRDIKPVYLAPADGLAAFRGGQVDAWAIWDPYYAAAQAMAAARVLADGTGLVENRQFYLAERSFAARAPGLLGTVLEQIGAADTWANAHKAELAALLAPQIGLPASTLQASIDRLVFGITPMTPEVARQQQQIADAFHGIGLLPRAVNVRDAVWTRG